MKVSHFQKVKKGSMYCQNVYVLLSQSYCRIFLSALYPDIVNISCLFLRSDKFQKRKVSQLGILDRYDKVCAPCLNFSKISKLDLWLYVRFNGVEIDLNTKIGDSNQSTNFEKLCFLVVFATNRVAGLYYLHYLQK